MLGNIVYTPAPAAAVATSLTIGTTPIVGGTAGAVLFESTANKVSEKPTLLFMDTVNNRIGIGTITPARLVDFASTTRTWIQLSTTSAADLVTLRFTNSGTTQTCDFNLQTDGGFSIGGNTYVKFSQLVRVVDAVEIGNTGSFRGRLLVSTNPVSVSSYGLINCGAGGFLGAVGGFLGSVNGTIYTANIATGVLCDFMNLQINGISKFSISNAGLVKITTTTEQLRLGYDSTNFASFTTNSTGALTITLTGTALSTFFTDKVVLGNTITLAPYTFATLPAAPLAGQKAYIIDALAPVYLAPAVGGGLIFCPVFYNGVNWVTC